MKTGTVRSMWLLLMLLFLGNVMFAQSSKTAPNQRVWSVKYWNKMAAAGHVEYNPQIQFAPAEFTGSGIDALSVMVDDSPDVPVINAGNTTQSENSIFVNPLDPLKALNSNNSTENPVGALYGTSGFMTADGGLTWGGSVQGTGGSNSGDPAAVIDLNGRYFVGYIADDLGQGVAYSDDEGQTWTHVQAAPSPGGFFDVLDKNHLWVDNSPSSPHEGNLYAAWTRFQSGSPNDSEIEVVRSTDGGLSWSAPINVSSAVNAGSHNQGVHIQTGPNGEVYVSWAIYDAFPADETAMGLAVSLDGGATYSPAVRIINDIRGIRNTTAGKNHRVASFPSTAADISGSGNNGTLYLVWNNVGVPGTNTGTDVDVYMSKSTDGGASWSTPLRVNQDPSGLGKKHYHSWITADPETGNLSVIFYDDRNVSSTDCEVYVANSLTAGDTWEDFKVSDVSFTPAPIPGLAGGYFGDYLGIAARGGRVYPCWTDNRTGSALTYVSVFQLADPEDPNPPDAFNAYSDFTTPTEMALNWSDPTTLVNGTPITSGDFEIVISRDGAQIATVAGGIENYTDTGLSDGTLYAYSAVTRLLLNDSTSLAVGKSWHAGGSPVPGAPSSLVCDGSSTVDAVLTWNDPVTQNDGTPLDDLDSLRIWRNGVVVASVAPGVTTYTDTPPLGFVYQYAVTAVDNETPRNESNPSNVVDCYVGSTPKYLVWVGPDATAASAQSGDSVFAALVANGESSYLTNDLFEFGNDLSIYDGVFVVLGIFSNNHTIGASDPEGPALDAYLAGGGKIYLEGADCFNYDPEVGGYNIRPWFSLNDGPDGSSDLSAITGLNDLAAFSFSYVGENNWMDELQPVASTPVWQNSGNTDISGVYFAGYNGGTGAAIGVVPSFGGLVDSPTPVSKLQRPLAASEVVRKAADNGYKVRQESEQQPFVKKAAFYPELKANRKQPGELYRINADGGLEMLANTKVDLMAAYLELLGAGSSSGANPKPPTDFAAYSDYTTPTEMALSWTDPSAYGNGDPLTDFTIEVYRDGGFVASVAMGTENYTDTGLNDGQVYDYEIFAKDLNDSTSTPVAASWTAGGAATPSAPDSLAGVGGPNEAVLTWNDPTTQVDGTPLDDLDHINIYRDGALIGNVPAGTGTYTDTPPPGLTYNYHVTAVDNEVPANESAPSNTVDVYVGGTTNFLVWVGPDATAASAESGDSIFAALAANGESVFLTNDLFEFGNDLSVYEGIFVVLGIFSNNHVIGAADPEGPALDAYLAAGGRLYLEGGDCFNYDPEVGGYQIRPWFSLDDGPDGSADLAGINGLNDLSAFNFSYVGENNWMDELQPVASTPIWQNNANTDISGIFNVGYNNGGGRAIGVVPSFGGLVDNPAPVSPYLRPLAASAVPHKPATQGQKIRAERGEAYVFKKKGAYYPELKANRKQPGELYRIKPGGGLEILANTKVDLMAAYLELFRSSGAPQISVVPTALADTLFVDGTNDHTVTISNAGGTLAGDLTYSITENPAVDWLSATPLSGTLGANSSNEITVSLDAGGLSAGDYSTTLEVASNDTTNPLVIVTVDLHVSDPPVIAVNPTEVSEVLNAVGDSVDVPMQLSNSGGAPLVWSATVVAFKNGRVVTGKTGNKGPANSDYRVRNSEYPYVAVVTEDVWDLQFSANLEVVTGALGNAGSEFDGAYYYTTRWASNLLHKIDMSGSLVEEFSISGVTGLRDLAFDGTYMYGGAAGNTIYQMDFATKTLVGTISSPVAVRHIAYDEANDAFWVGNWDTNITLVSRSGATLSTITPAVHGLGGMYGSAYDGWTAGGPYLWVFDQGLGAGFPQLLHQIDLNSNTPTGVTYDVTVDFPTTAGIAGGLFTTEGIVSGTASIGGLLQGTPDNLFAYELAAGGANTGWVKLVGNTSGVINPGDSDGFIVRLTALQADTTFTGECVIATNIPGAELVNIPVTLHVSPVGIEDDQPLPTTYAVSKNYPNPFNPTTTISYQLPEASDVKLVVYNVLGQKVRTLVNARMQTGRYQAVWDAHNDAGTPVGSGIYIFRFEAGSFSKVQKMILLK